VATVVHRFEESIEGQQYLIEVEPVGGSQWRACMVRRPGVPTALMPFYASTPEAAADLLRQWLRRARRRTAGGQRRE
jgi:hypothetical protein